MCPSCGEPEIDAYGTCLHCGYAVTGEDRSHWADEDGKACQDRAECTWPKCECPVAEGLRGATVACEYKKLPRNRSKIVFTDSAPSYCTVGRVYGVGYYRNPRSGYVDQVSLSSSKGMTHTSAYLFDTIGWGWRYADDADLQKPE